MLGSPVCLLSRHACRFLRVHVLSCDACQNGFVPNYSAAGAKSQDRSEEIIGSKVLLSLYQQYKEEWIVSLLFDDLLDWLEWAHVRRTLGPLNLITQGSDNITGVDGLKEPDGAMCNVQGGRYEQADNGVVYDCPVQHVD